MGRSNETFNKKEKEKKRLKKLQDKKDKAEQRRANSDKGKGLEYMMAYVDEYGNITTTPPISSKSKPVTLSDIAIATPKQIAQQEDVIKNGIISFFNTAKGFGFIKDNTSKENIFFHKNGLTYQAKENDHVTFSIAKGPKGLSAVEVRKK